MSKPRGNVNMAFCGNCMRRASGVLFVRLPFMATCFPPNGLVFARSCAGLGIAFHDGREPRRGRRCSFWCQLYFRLCQITVISAALFFKPGLCLCFWLKDIITCVSLSTTDVMCFQVQNSERCVLLHFKMSCCCFFEGKSCSTVLQDFRDFFSSFGIVYHVFGWVARGAHKDD